MKLSIFLSANAHPQNAAEKKVVSYQVSKPNIPTTVEFENDDDLIRFVTTYAWSPFVFSGHRHADNFISCDLLVYDIDDGLTIDEAKIVIENEGLCCLALPTPSHTEEHHKFRIIIPLSRTIYNSDVYIATWAKGAELFGVVDPSCKDLARYYNGSTIDDGFWEEGSFFEPVEIKLEQLLSASAAKGNELMLPVSGDIKDVIKSIYGEERNVVPEAVDFFVRNAASGMQGQWINALNRFCFSLALSGVGKDAILTVCNELAPQELDKKDLYQIKKAISDAEKLI